MSARTTLEKVLQDALESESERCATLQAALDTTTQRLNAIDAQMRGLQSEMVNMASDHYKTMADLQERHATEMRNIMAGRPIDFMPSAPATAPAVDLAPLLAQIQQSFGVSLSSISTVVEKMDMRVTAMARELAAMPAPPTELQFDVMDDGAGGNIRIIARGKK